MLGKECDPPQSPEGGGRRSLSPLLHLRQVEAGAQLQIPSFKTCNECLAGNKQVGLGQGCAWLCLGRRSNQLACSRVCTSMLEAALMPKLPNVE